MGCCRAGGAAKSPLEELEVALDAMNSMQSTFCVRYKLYSAVYRRVGGQGVVQFAGIGGTYDKVCSTCNWRVALATSELAAARDVDACSA